MVNSNASGLVLGLCTFRGHQTEEGPWIVAHNFNPNIQIWFGQWAECWDILTTQQMPLVSGTIAKEKIQLCIHHADQLCVQIYLHIVHVQTQIILHGI